jgi:capsular exopolysaccharide synthesis family protein
MSKIYRALEKAEQERQQKIKGPRLFGEDGKGMIEERAKIISRPFERRREKWGIPEGEAVPILIDHPHSFGAEQFRKIRTDIFLQSHNPPQTILVTGSIAEEGKTTVAFNLAVAIAQEIHKEAVLIDADLRKPSSFVPLTDQSKGLADYLLGRASLPEILKSSEIENLWIIPSGEPPQKPAELIGSRKMTELLNELKLRGEDTCVVIDSPPLLVASESIILSRMVDGIIMVVMADRAPKTSVRKAVASIDRQKIIGVVFNNKELKASKFHNYYKYYRDK